MSTKTLLIAGSRGYGNYKELSREVKNYIENVEDVQIITGCARGVDYMAKMFALENNIPCTVYLAEWNKYGKSAGPIRNRQMAEKAQAGLIFWDGKSKGTENMLAELKKNGVNTVKVIRF